MMKKVLSLILVAVMLLGVLPATAFAETTTATFDGYTLSLGDSIAVEFYAKAAKLADFQKVVFYKNDVKVQEITTCPAAESDGYVYFKFDTLGPHEMDARIKAELYLTTAEEATHAPTVCILDYCTAILGTADEKLKKLIVNMLYYGAAAEAYVPDSGTEISTYIDGLDADVKALQDTSEVSSSQLTKTLLRETTGKTVEWAEAALVLNAGIVPSFTFTTTEDVVGLTAFATCAGKTWQTNKFTADGTSYTFDFTGLNPSQLQNPVYVEIRNAQGTVVSDVCAFTAEYYAANAAEAEKALANAMMNYGNAAKAYIQRDIVTTGLLSAAEENALKAFTGENQYEFKTLVADAYAAAGIDLSQYIPYEPWFDLANNFFYTRDGNPNNDNATDYQLRSDIEEPYSNMLLPGYYGGYRHDTDKLFSADDFKVGDLFFGTYKCSGFDGWNYIAGIYQGDGKFLIYDSHPAAHTECTSGVKTEVVSDTSTVISGDADVMNKYALYYVLRPQGASRRDITTGALTAAEMAAIAGYEIRAPYFWYTIATDVYLSAGIESAAFDSSLTFNKLYPKVLSTTEVSDYTKMLVPGHYGGSSASTGKSFTPADLKVGDIIATATAKCANGSWTYLTGVYQGEGKFQVSKRCCNQEGCSGVYEDIYSATPADGILTNGMTSFWGTAAQLEAAYQRYFVLRPERLAANALQSISLNKTELTVTTLYSETLTVTGNPASALGSVTWTSSDSTIATVDANGKVSGVATGTAIITANCEGYTATCEVTVAATRNITAGGLTDAEEEAIANYEAEAGVLWYALATNAYNAAGISVDAFNTKIGFNDLRKAVFNTTESDYTKMLVPGLYGGRKNVTGKTFTPDDLEVGDIIATATAKCANGSWTYLTGVYVGNGQFQVTKRCCTTEGCAFAYVDDYNTKPADGILTNGMTSFWGTAAQLEAAYEYYFVLRPSNLAN